MKFTGKHLCQRLFWPATLLKSPWHRWFPVNFVKFLRTSFLKQNRNTPALRQITSASLIFPLDLCSHSIMKIKHLADCCSEILLSILVQFKVHIYIQCLYRIWNRFQRWCIQNSVKHVMMERFCENNELLKSNLAIFAKELHL